MTDYNRRAFHVAMQLLSEPIQHDAIMSGLLVHVHADADGLFTYEELLHIRPNQQCRKISKQWRPARAG
jgi:hypothetical protein